MKSEKLNKEYNKYVNKQFEILKGHHARIMLRIHNKFMELKNKEMQD